MFFGLTSIFYAQSSKEIPDNFCVSLDEQLLYDKINLLRLDYGKSDIEFSVSLSYVAAVHIEDLTKNRPDTSVCNLSSWSDKGDWTACCYNPYVPNQDCMWDKPKELTPYPYRGYELVGYFEDGFTVDSVIQLWAETKAVLDMLLTDGNFKKKKWITMGVAMNEEYVSVWFGQRADRLGEPDLCTNKIDTPEQAAIISTEAAPITYYLIFGSFSDPKDAKEAVKRYKKNGFEEAGTIPGEGMTRVYLGKYTDLKEIMYVKQKLPYTYREAWIYKE